MQKNAYKIIALTLLLMLLCGCKQSRSLGERAIVKMVYLDESGGQVQAGLVVFRERALKKLCTRRNSSKTKNRFMPRMRFCFWGPAPRAM